MVDQIEIVGITFSWDAILTVLSIFGALVAFVYRSWSAQRQERRENTFQLLSRIFEDGPVCEARITMARWVAQGRILQNDDIGPHEEKVVLMLIDFYEFMCEGALRGVVDCKLLNQEAGGRMERAYFVVQGYEKARQDRLTRLNKERGLGPVVLHKHLREFLRKYRGLNIAVS